MAGETNYAEPTKGSKLNDGNSKAMKYLEQLLDEGHNEGISEAELHLPSWFDANLFKEAQDTMKSYRLFMSAGFLAGFIAILSIPSMLAIFKCTGQSGTEKKIYRRYIATTMHAMVWYTEPPNQQSLLWRSMLLVRKAHIRSSNFCLKKQRGRITQRDMAITQFCLIGLTTLEAERMGLNDDRFLESNIYMWRVLGHMLGIKDEYNVCAETWKETKPRFELLLKRVLQPALKNAGPEFYEMSALLCEGLRPVHKVFTFDAILFYVRHLAGCEGYEVLDRDFPDEDQPASRNKERFYSLKLWDRLSVATVVIMFRYFYRISVVRWYLNACAQLGMWFQTYFPYLAIYRYGWSWAYVRIFKETKNKTL